ncbi:tetratricopeptide repeat protein [Chamaesiphon sp. VAR_48_metabat_403]|uniref:tetratricopeptide repeat protein n=1 Tax=Chamaesiphon sp. VAR_48_metabat_403 TaxID=2964700 RepID=UPI00286D779F|nr:tetratricopeptide repeat protein [Chamaesiphon sp. VAR_48_metabat_403]
MAQLSFDRAIKLNPNLAEAYYNRGAVRYELGDKHGTISDLDRAIEINPNLAEAYYN